MLNRIIPVLLIKDGVLVKTKRFRSPTYIGDPVNTLRIFNEREADEIILLDISKNNKKFEINFDLISRAASECFMPLAYGGGVRTLSDFERLFSCGIEKVAVNTMTQLNPSIVEKAADRFGNQAIIGSMDIIHSRFFGPMLFNRELRRKKVSPADWAQRLESMGVGEILVNSVDRDGTWLGFDKSLAASVVESVSIPVIPLGGASGIDDLIVTLTELNTSAISAGSMFVFQKEGAGVLVSYPDELERGIGI